MQSPFAYLQLQGPHWIIQPGGKQDLDSGMEWLGQFLLGLFIWLPSWWLVFVWGQGGNAQGLLWLGWLLVAGRWATFPQFPPDWFKADAGVGNSLAMWPHPWHLKHWREFDPTYWLCPPSLCPVPWLFWPLPLVPWPPAPYPVGRLWAKVACPCPLLPL